MINEIEFSAAVFDEMIKLAQMRDEISPTGLSTPEEVLAHFAAEFPIPTVAQLRAVLPPAFWASLLEEEGRPIEFRLGLCQPEDLLNQVQFHDFKEPRDFSAEELRKLAPGVNPEVGFLNIQFDGDNPKIVGIGTHGKYEGKRPLIVHVHPGGEIEVSWCFFRLAHYHSGRIDRLSDYPTNYQGLMKGLLATIGLTRPEDVDVIRLLERVVEIIWAHGHGGSIWMLGTGVALIGVDVKYPMDAVRSGSTTQSNQMEELVQEPHWPSALGQMSAVDGAVVLGPSSEVLGFGAFIELVDVPQVQRLGKNGVWETVDGTSVGGGRHRSAVVFCNLHRPSLALVASQDGGLTVMTSGRTGLVRLTPWSPLGPDV